MGEPEANSTSITTIILRVDERSPQGETCFPILLFLQISLVTPFVVEESSFTLMLVTNHMDEMNESHLNSEQKRPTTDNYQIDSIKGRKVRKNLSMVQTVTAS
jgi:hypothetical protein